MCCVPSGGLKVATKSSSSTPSSLSRRPVKIGVDVINSLYQVSFRMCRDFHDAFMTIVLGALCLGQWPKTGTPGHFVT